MFLSHKEKKEILFKLANERYLIQIINFFTKKILSIRVIVNETLCKNVYALIKLEISLRALEKLLYFVLKKRFLINK